MLPKKDIRLTDSKSLNASDIGHKKAHLDLLLFSRLIRYPNNRNMRYFRKTSKEMHYFVMVVAIVLASTIRAQECEPCASGETPSDDQEEDCVDLIAATKAFTAGTAECGLGQLENYQEGCCEEAPRGVCTLCPDGASFNAATVVPNFDPDDGDQSCADLNGKLAFLDYVVEGGTCEDTWLQRSAAWCGCPDIERQCFLCPDGSKPPNPTLVDPV
jgi:hypothetical protein